MGRPTRGRRWEDASRVVRAAVRHDLEEALQGKIDKAYRRYCVAVNTGKPKRVQDQLLARVQELREQLKRAEQLAT